MQLASKFILTKIAVPGCCTAKYQRYRSDSPCLRVGTARYVQRGGWDEQQRRKSNAYIRISGPYMGLRPRKRFAGKIVTSARVIQRILWSEPYRSFIFLFPNSHSRILYRQCSALIQHNRTTAYITLTIYICICICTLWLDKIFQIQIAVKV